jgi:hypothetical protein
MYELIYGDPIYTGATDAAKAGMGGIWFVDGKAILWRVRFPPEIQASLVSTTNLTGTITNSDLELAATIAQHHVLVEAGYSTAGESTHNFCDNTPAVAWQTKGSTTTTPVTADLLRHAALQQRQTGHVQRFEHLAGIRNSMADDASRLWHHTDTNRLSYFDSRYPQTEPWQMHHLSQPVHSELISLLSRQKWQPASLPNVPKPRAFTGTSGSVSVMTCASTPVSSISETPSPSFKSSCEDSDKESWPPVASPSQLAMLRTRPAPWARQWPAWGPGTFARTRGWVV